MTRSSTPACLVIIVSVLALQCRAKQEEAISVNDVGEGNLCDQDQKVAGICLACSSLPFNVDVSLVACCSTETGYQFCSACVEDRDSCAKLVDEIDAFQKYSESNEDYYDELADDSYDMYDADLLDDEEGAALDPLNDAREKRFGTLFMTSPKRYGRLLFGKRVPEKRYGRLYMGSGGYFGKRSSMEFPGFESDLYGDDRESNGVDKRFGYLLGSSYKLGKREDELAGDDYVPEKRYGQLFMGKNKWFGKRNKDKRFGRLFVGSNGMFGKRSDDDNVDVAKRYGRLFMGRRRGKLFG